MEEENKPILWVHKPTMWGLSEVQAGGRRVSNVDAKPWTMLYPVTEAVIEPKVEAARASVEM